MLNKVLLIGRLTKDIEMRGNEKTNYITNTLAVRRDYKNKDGEYDTDFVNVTFFKSQAMFLHDYANKGMLISIVGKLQENVYTDTNGKNIYSLNVICEEVNLLEKASTQTKEKNKFNQEEKQIKSYDDLTPFDDLFR